VIASLRGTVLSSTLNSVVLDVAGVGYLVQVTPGLALTVSKGQELSLVTAFIVREDAFTIFGFESSEELSTFDLLRSVTGVGPKLALSIIHQLGVEALSNAVANEDDAAFKSVSGIGPKTAKLLVVTLAGKLSGGNTQKASASDADIVAALVGLGYQSKVAEEAVKASRASNPNAANDIVLRTALQGLARK
jgi:Holliday junction DNA helicase RuvA